MTILNMTDVRTISLHNKNVTRIVNANGEMIWPTPSLPSTFTRGDYLQQHLSDNRGAYFAFPIGLTTNDQLELTLSFNSLGTEEETLRGILGCHDEETEDIWGLQILNDQLYFNGELVQNLSLSTDTIYNIIIKDNELRVNNTLVHTSLIYPFEWNYIGFYDLIISNQNYYEDSWQADINVYKFRFKQNGVYSYDCVPAVNNLTNTTGLYNLIGQLHYYDYRNPTILTVENNS